jgi:hypothetical protein
MLLGYHYALRQQAKLLAKEKIEIQQRKESAIAASNAARRAQSDASHTNARRNRRHGSRYENLKYSERQSISKNLDSSFLSVDEQGNIIPKTPEAPLVAAQAYLLTKTSNIQKGKASPKTSTRPSYRSMSKGTSYQKPLKHH